MIEFIRQPWPWYVCGPLIGLTVPILLILGNRPFGISSSLQHICAACIPANIPLFKYDWRKEVWNLFFVIGILVGGLITSNFLRDPNPIQVDPQLVAELTSYGITNITSLMPTDIMNWTSLFSLKGLIMMVGGGFLVGFGTRYANGCTSGHTITGLSTLQWPSLVASCAFMAGGLLMANVFLGFILSL